MAPTTPLPTSGVVGDLWLASTVRPRSSTASVFVPPTSTPIRSTSDIKPPKPKRADTASGLGGSRVNAGGE